MKNKLENFLKRLVYVIVKLGTVPSKADVAEQETFKKTLYSILKEANEGDRTVFFVDAAHFVLSPFLGYLWCFARLFLKAPSGRQRFKCPGGLLTL